MDVSPWIPLCCAAVLITEEEKDTSLISWYWICKALPIKLDLCGMRMREARGGKKGKVKEGGKERKVNLGKESKVKVKKKQDMKAKKRGN